MKDLSFGEAVIHVENGEMVAREGWNGKDMFIFTRPGDTLPVDFIEKVKSLPKKVKTFLMNRGKDVEFTEYLCMYTASGKIANGWIPSQADILANDYYVVK